MTAARTQPKKKPIDEGVLAPVLYGRLREVFGVVKVHCAGEAMVDSGFYTDPCTGKVRMEISHNGEYYAVSCPFCRDTRFRLNVNHRYGQYDAAHGRRLKFLAVCYNEGCLSKDDNADELWAMIEAGDRLRGNTVRIGRTVDWGSMRVSPPGPLVRVDRLPASHEAHRYLVGRGYDPALVGPAYGVSYCHTSQYSLAARRIVVPCFYQGKLKGWQARYVGELKWKQRDDDPHKLPPKWYSCPGMKKSKLVGNVEEAAKYRTLVVVEGPFDVLGFGPMAGYTFGSSLSEEQAGLVASAAAGRPVVLLWDPDTQKPKKGSDSDEPVYRHAEERLRAAMKIRDDEKHKRLAVVWLPDGFDPGKLPRAQMRQFVADEARAQGVHVDWRKR